MIGIFSYLVFFLSVVLILGVACLGLNLQWGFTGLFNAGVVGFYAVGGYALAILTAPPQPAAPWKFRPSVDRRHHWRDARRRARGAPRRHGDRQAARRLSGDRHLRRGGHDPAHHA